MLQRSSLLLTGMVIWWSLKLRKLKLYKNTRISDKTCHLDVCLSADGEVIMWASLDSELSSMDWRTCLDLLVPWTERIFCQSWCCRRTSFFSSSIPGRKLSVGRFHQFDKNSVDWFPLGVSFYHCLHALNTDCKVYLSYVLLVVLSKCCLITWVHTSCHLVTECSDVWERWTKLQWLFLFLLLLQDRDPGSLFS